MKLFLSLAAIGAAATLGACGPTPADPPEQNDIAASMPDTDAVKGTGAQMAPDAGATGTIPTDGSAPPVQPGPPPVNAPPLDTGTGAGAADGNPNTTR